MVVVPLGEVPRNRMVWVASEGFWPETSQKSCGNDNATGERDPYHKMTRAFLKSQRCCFLDYKVFVGRHNGALALMKMADCCRRGARKLKYKSDVCGDKVFQNGKLVLAGFGRLLSVSRRQNLTLLTPLLPVANLLKKKSYKKAFKCLSPYRKAGYIYGLSVQEQTTRTAYPVNPFTTRNQFVQNEIRQKAFNLNVWALLYCIVYFLTVGPKGRNTIGFRLIILSKSLQTNTKMIGLRWFTRFLCSLNGPCNVTLAMKGLTLSWPRLSSCATTAICFEKCLALCNMILDVKHAHEGYLLDKKIFLLVLFTMHL